LRWCTNHLVSLIPPFDNELEELPPNSSFE
jgi:hypothetical protein